MGNSLTGDALIKLEAVHPHACGELTQIRYSQLFVIGSSPRLWGTHAIRKLEFTCWRFIPTLVGNSNQALRFLSSLPVHPHACGELHPVSHYQTLPPVHPHACGELIKRSQVITHFVGSSPRLWGTLDFTCVDYSHDRFIPTLVGNSREIISSRGTNTVHPHACGELSMIISSLE